MRRGQTCCGWASAHPSRSAGCSRIARGSACRSRSAWARPSTFWPGSNRRLQRGCRSTVWNGCSGSAANRDGSGDGISFTGRNLSFVSRSKSSATQDSGGTHEPNCSGDGCGGIYRASSDDEISGPARVSRPRRRRQAAGVRAVAGSGVRDPGPPAVGQLPDRHSRCRGGVRPGGQHGRHRVHPQPQGRDQSGQRLDQHPYARGRAGERREAVPLHLVRLRLSRLSPRLGRRETVERGRRLSSRRRGWLWVGEALHGARLPSLHRGFRPRDARRAVPQHLWTARHVRGGAREIPRRDLPQGGPCEGRRRHRGVGRWQADTVVLLYR